MENNVSRERSELLLQIISEIKSGERACIWDTDGLKIDDLLYSDESGKSLIDYILEKNIFINSKYLNFFIPYEPLILKKYISYNKVPSDIDEDILFEEIELGETLIETLFKKEIIELRFITIIEEHTEIIDLCVKYNKYYLKHINKKLLFKDKDGQSCLKTILYEGIIPYNVTDEELFEYIDGDDRLINFLFENNVFEERYYNFSRNNYKKLIDLSIEYNKKQYLEFIEEDMLLDEKYGKTYLDIILDMGVVPSALSRLIKNEKILNHLYKLNRPDLLINGELKLLLHDTDNNLSYLEYIIDCFKKGIYVDFSKLHIENVSKSDLAELYILYSEYGMLNYLERKSVNELLEFNDGEKCLLEELVEKDQFSTRQILRYFRLLNNYEIIIFLRSRNIILVPEYYELPMYDKDAFSYEYILDSNEKNKPDYIPFEVECLLSDFKNIMLEDGKSDEEAVNQIIVLYRYLISNNNKYAVDTIKKLIDIKTNFPYFRILKTNPNVASHFSSSNASLNLQNGVFSTIIHEVTHALQYFLTDNICPNELDNIILEIKSGPFIIDKIKEIADKIYVIQTKLFLRVEEEFKKWSKKYYTRGRKSKIKKFLKKCKSEQIEYYKGKGYSEDVLSVVFDETFTLEEYRKTENNIKSIEMMQFIFRNEFEELLAVEDIIDAIYAGKLLGGKVKDSSGNKINWISGHGEKYYDTTQIMFLEMVANFAEIVNSPRANEGLKLLRDVVGDKLVNLLQEFYENELIYSEKFEEEKNKKI